MKVENPVALRFILQDELYLLKSDEPMYEILTVGEPEIEEVTPDVAIIEQAEPIVRLPERVTVSIAPEVKPASKFKYLGKNLKRFLVLVHYPELEFIDNAHLIALTNIIKRKDLSIDDIIIFNIAHYGDAQYDELVKFFKPGRLLVLGKNATPQGITALTLNTPLQLENISVLHSFSFGEMMDNVAYKKAFWEQVKSF